MNRLTYAHVKLCSTCKTKTLDIIPIVFLCVCFTNNELNRVFNQEQKLVLFKNSEENEGKLRTRLIRHKFIVVS